MARVFEDLRRELSRLVAMFGSSFISPLLLVGVTPGEGDSERRRTSILNAIALISIVSSFLNAIAFVQVGVASLIPALGAVAFASALVMFLNGQKRHLAARALFVIAGNTAILYFSLRLGRFAGVHLIYFTALVLPFLLFSPRTNRMLFLVALAFPICASPIALWWSHLFPVAPLALPDDKLRVIWLTMFISSCLLISVSVGYFVQAADRRERDLRGAIERQAIAYGLVVHDAASYLFTTATATQTLKEVLEDRGLDFDRPTAASNQADSNTTRSTDIVERSVSAMIGGLRRLEALVISLRSQLAVQHNAVPLGARRGDVMAALERVLSLLPARGFAQQVRVTLDESLRGAVVGMKEEELIHVFDNLIGNALQHLSRETGGGAVIVHRETQTLRNGPIVIAISDDGSGLSPAAFEQMSRVTGGDIEPEHSSMTLTPVGGHLRSTRSSLGLRLVRLLVENAGGEITCESPAVHPLVAGRGGWRPGTTIRIKLPSAPPTNSPLANLTAAR